MMGLEDAVIRMAKIFYVTCIIRKRLACFIWRVSKGDVRAIGIQGIFSQIPGSNCFLRMPEISIVSDNLACRRGYGVLEGHGSL
jgi:hypothetical protein